MEKIANPKPQDVDEVIDVLELSYKECMDLVAQGKLVDAKTLIALQYYALHLGGDQ